MLLSLDIMLSCNDILLSSDRVRCVLGFLGQLSRKDGVYEIKVTRRVIYKMLAEQ